MAGGPLLPSSVYFGGAAGNAYPAFYIAGAATGGGAIANSPLEGAGVVASLGADAPVVLQFNLPESIPTGTAKLRMLAMANATTGTAYWNISDGQTAAGAAISGTTLTSENSGNSYSQVWATADILVENKITLTTAPTANDILTVVVTFKHTQVGGGAGTWSLAQASVWQLSLVWE